MAERPSPTRLRTQRLLFGGLIGGHLAALVAVAGAWAVDGLAATASAGIAAVMVITFMAIGHAVQLLMADARPQVVLIAALTSYAARVGALGVALAVVLGNPDRFAGLVPSAFAIGAIAAVVGWLAGELWTYSRLRIPVFDSTGNDSPSGENG